MSRREQIEDRAARWILRREEGDWSEVEQRAFGVWLAESDEHKVAYWRLKHGWREMDRMASLGPLPAAESTLPRARWKPLAVAASLLLTIGFGPALFQPYVAEPPVRRASFETEVGARKLVSLSDGSRIELNTRSRIRAVVSPRQREVWLDQGEAYFEIAHQSDRPFLVHAGNRTITVLGTKFSVRRDNDKVTVSVVEGKVRVSGSDPDAQGPTAIITGGDIAVASGDSTLLARKLEKRVDNDLSWRDDLLRFDETRLIDIVREFNRYNRQQIILTDSALDNMRIGGGFPTRKPEEFVNLMRNFYGIESLRLEGEKVTAATEQQ